MLSGFNTNFRHRGVLFHVQTEDSGRANPHVITHLFHGGNILASEKGTYSDKLGSESKLVQGLIQNAAAQLHLQMGNLRGAAGLSRKAWQRHQALAEELSAGERYMGLDVGHFADEIVRHFGPTWDAAWGVQGRPPRIVLE